MDTHVRAHANTHTSPAPDGRMEGGTCTHSDTHAHTHTHKYDAQNINTEAPAGRDAALSRQTAGSGALSVLRNGCLVNGDGWESASAAGGSLSGPTGDAGTAGSLENKFINSS